MGGEFIDYLAKEDLFKVYPCERPGTSSETF